MPYRLDVPCEECESITIEGLNDKYNGCYDVGWSVEQTEEIFKKSDEAFMWCERDKSTAASGGRWLLGKVVFEGEKKEEIKHKDFCVDEFNTNELQTEKKDRAKQDLTAKIEDLESTIKSLTAAIDQLKSEVAEMQVQMKRAGEDREKENKEFQATVADQRATQKLLTAALNILKGFYAKKAAFVQVEQPAGPPPPPGFEAYKKNAAAGGVMGMIQQIINDAKAMEAEVIRSEEDAQKAYEDFVKDTNASIEAASKSIVEKSEEKAKKEVELNDAEEALDAVVLELEQLANYKEQLHSSCDFVLKNFEIRQTARDEEIEALKQAKAILSGAKFDAFLQRGA